MSTVRVAAAQYPIEFLGEWGAYAGKIESWVAEAANHGAQLLLFPEYGSMELTSLLPAADRADLARQLALLQPRVEDVNGLHRLLARRHRVTLVGASIPVRGADGLFRNRAHVFGPEGAVGFQDKLMMTRFEAERWGISPGSPLRVFDTAAGRIGIAICYDAEFPLIGQGLAAAGADILLVPSCTDAEAGYRRVRIGAQARALENQCYVVQAPTVGDAPWSPAVDTNVGAAGFFAPPDHGLPPSGVIAEGPMSQPQWVYADLDLERLRAVRRDGQVLNRRDWPTQAKRAAIAVEVQDITGAAARRAAV